MSDEHTKLTDKQFEDVEELPGGQRWETWNRRWVDKSGNPLPNDWTPSLGALQDAKANTILKRLGDVVPLIERLTTGLEEAAITTVVREVLARVNQTQLAAWAHALVTKVVAEQRGGNWDLERRVREMTEAALRQQVEIELQKHLEQSPMLLAIVVADALKKEKLAVQAENLIAPRLVKLVEDLRFELVPNRSMR